MECPYCCHYSQHSEKHIEWWDWGLPRDYTHAMLSKRHEVLAIEEVKKNYIHIVVGSIGSTDNEDMQCWVIWRVPIVKTCEVPSSNRYFPDVIDHLWYGHMFTMDVDRWTKKMD